MNSKSANRYPPELREHAVRMILEHRSEYDSGPDDIRAISSKFGCHYDTLRAWLSDTHSNVSPRSFDDGGLLLMNISV